jgi:hypothetical protein
VAHPVDIPLVSMEVLLSLEILPTIAAPEGSVRLLTQMRHLIKHYQFKITPLSNSFLTNKTSYEESNRVDFQTNFSYYGHR